MRQEMAKKEFARRGQEIYESQVRLQVEEGNKGKIVAIDIQTGDFGMGENTLEASDNLLVKRPDAEGWIWSVRIGYPYVHRI